MKMKAILDERCPYMSYARGCYTGHPRGRDRVVLFFPRNGYFETKMKRLTGMKSWSRGVLN